MLFRAPRAATVKAPWNSYLATESVLIAQARTDAVLWSVDRKSFEACGGRSEGSMARTACASALGASSCCMVGFLHHGLPKPRIMPFSFQAEVECSTMFDARPYDCVWFLLECCSSEPSQHCWIHVRCWIGCLRFSLIHVPASLRSASLQL